MNDVRSTTRTLGTTNRGRQLAGATMLLAGAAACAVATIAEWPLYQTLMLVGGAATLAWLVSGSSRRFMGPGLTALAVGGGITLYRSLELEVGEGEHTFVYPLIGAALIVASLFNPMAIRGAGTFLVIVAAVATIDTSWNPGWTLAVALLSWGVLDMVRITRSEDHSDVHRDDTVDGEPDRRGQRIAGSQETVGAHR